MADEAKATAGSKTWLWMLAALVVVVGFLVWLGSVSEPTQTVATVEEDDATQVAPGEEGATVVAKDTLAADKSRFAGQRIRVSQIEATGMLGPRIFWGELGDPSRQVPILVRMDSAVAGRTSVQTGSAYTITGQLEPMSDSLATQWAEQNQFTGEGEQMQAAFADYYIQATSVRPSRGGGSAGTGGGQAQSQQPAQPSDG